MNTVGAVSTGILIGAIPGQNPAVVESPTITLSASRATSADLLTQNKSNTIPGSISQVDMPSTVLSESASNTGASIPAAVDTSFSVMKSNIYAFGEKNGSSTDAPLVSFSLSSSGVGGGRITVTNLSTPIKILIPHPGMPEGYQAQCRFWDEACLLPRHHFLHIFICCGCLGSAFNFMSI
jgi:hypothetical protein